MTSRDENSLGMVAHLLGLISGFVGPLIMFLVLSSKKGKAYKNAKHALNFQISLVLYYIVSFILMIILIGFVLLIALSVFNLVVTILAAVRANNGEIYKYPLEIPFIR